MEHFGQRGELLRIREHFSALPQSNGFGAATDRQSYMLRRKFERKTTFTKPSGLESVHVGDTFCQGVSPERQSAQSARRLNWEPNYSYGIRKSTCW
jgi:hypothetical protein